MQRQTQRRNGTTFLEDALGFDAQIPGGVGLDGQNYVDDGRTAKGDQLCTQALVNQ